MIRRLVDRIAVLLGAAALTASYVPGALVVRSPDRRRATLASTLVVAVAAFTVYGVFSNLGTATVGERSAPGRGSDGSSRPIDGHVSERSAEPRYGDSPAAAGFPMADEIQAAQGALPMPFGPPGSYHLADYATTYVNVRNGERATVAPAPCSCRPVRVWFTGGSAAFGFGQRDDHTIASALVRAGSADDMSLEVHNLATPGWTLWQEYLGVLEHLGAGNPAPDLVVFYDGFNDIFQSVMQTALGTNRWDEPISFRGEIQQRLVDVVSAEAGPLLRSSGGATTVGQRAAERYERLRRLVETTLHARGIATAWFFQPNATASAEQRRTGLARPGSVDESWFDALHDAIGTTAAHLDSSVHDLLDLFDDHPEPVFFDVVHMNETGARIVADAIYRTLRPRLRSLAGSS